MFLLYQRNVKCKMLKMREKTESVTFLCGINLLMFVAVVLYVKRKYCQQLLK